MILQVVYFSRPNSDVPLRSLFEDPKEAEERGEELMNADAWVANRAKKWNSANYKGRESYKESRGTEHNRDKDLPTLDKPAKEVEAV